MKRNQGSGLRSEATVPGDSDSTARRRVELDLVEWETAPEVPLSMDQACRLRTLSPKVDVRPSLGGGFDVTATSWIGSVELEGLSLRIAPKVGIRSVLFLISYAVDPDRWREEDFAFQEEDTLLEAIAPGFVRLTQRALARGLRRDYRERVDTLQTVRGRVRFDEQIRRHYGRSPPVAVTYDEYTGDVAENRVLLAALERLGRLRLRSPAVRKRLRRLRARFEGVSLVEYRGRSLPDITFDRLNRHYRPAVRLASLILRDSAISERRGRRRSSSFLVDMNSVFEDFAVVALREALGVPERRFPQGARGRRLALDEDRRIRLDPDLSWWRRGRAVFVGDVKYKDIEERGVRNEDLYQVVAYLEATGLRDGLLVYPVEALSREVVVRRSGKRIHVAGWDLQRPPEDVLEQVERTADKIATWSHRPVEPLATTA